MPAKPTVKIEALALAVATGTTIKEWCQASGTPQRTAYEWASTAEFKQRVKELRSQYVEQTLSRLSDAGPVAVAVLKGLCEDGSVAEGVRRSAANSIVKLLIQASQFFDHESRIAELERRLGSGGTDHERH